MSNANKQASNKKPGTICFVSLGCDKNLVDSEVLVGLAVKAGWQVIPEAERADWVLINTCCFVEEAKEESIDTILGIAELKKKGRLKKLIVAGCLAQRYPQELAKELPEVDVFLGTGELYVLEELLSGNESERIRVARPQFLMNADTPRVLATPPYSANIKLSEGCSSHCAFCVIPRVRGPQRSRSIQDIQREAKKLRQQGVKELVLIGQNVTAYGQDRTDGASLAALLRTPELARGRHWVRLHYLYPSLLERELLESIRESDTVLPYIDMPVQHIDSKILKSMRRKDSEASTRTAIERVREILPNAVLRSTLIVGYPGETDAQFRHLLDFVAEGHFDRLGAFAFSCEEGTVAATLPDQITEKVKEDRLERLLEVQRVVSEERLQRYRGKVVDVLVEGASAEHEFLLSGRFWGQAREIDGVTYLTQGEAEVGTIRPVRITDSHEHDLVGRILKRKPSGHKLGPS